MSWQTYTRGVIPLHRAEIAIRGQCSHATKSCGVQFDRLIYAVEGKKMWWSWDKEQATLLGKKILSITSTKKGKEAHFRRMQKYADKSLISSEYIHTKDLSRLSNKELAGKYQTHYDNTVEAIGFLNADIDAVDIYPPEYLQELIKKKVPSTDFLTVYNKLTTLTHLTFVKKEENEFFKLANEIRKKKLTKSQIQKRLDKIKSKYWWSTLGWENTKIRDDKDYEKILKGYFSHKNPLKEIELSKQNIAKSREERMQLSKKYSLGKEIMSLIRLFDEYAYYHDLRKEVQVRTLYSFHLLMLEAAKRLGLREEEIEWLWHGEVCGMLLGKPLDLGVVDERKNATFLLCQAGDIIQYMGEEAIRRRREELEVKVDATVEIKGLPASRGNVQGNAKVCNGAEDAMRKIENGDIFVCGMTLPDYVPAMRKAAAIVTDEGGVTCHAAIVSRELGKPCITGTKIATHVLKDGDLVEVDADKGVVRKIN